MLPSFIIIIIIVAKTHQVTFAISPLCECPAQRVSPSTLLSVRPSFQEGRSAPRGLPAQEVASSHR